MKRFVLIDGNAILHRAYHALPPLTNKKGELVNAVYGFSSMLLKVIADLKPDYLAVAFDRPAPTFRQQLYVGYQAQRPKTAEELISQIELIHQVLESMGVAIFEIDGYEADDVIGTLAKKAQNLEAVIVSGDRDLLQLVNDKVRVYAPIMGLTKTILYDKKKVEQKYGIKPRQIVDYKALVGDPSDNYPGVLGIGPKTAAQLLKKFRNLEGIYKNLKKLPPPLVEKLAAGHETAVLSQQLAKIITDAPLTLKLKKIKAPKIIGNKQFGEKLREFGFKSLVRRVEGNHKKEGKKKNPKANPQLELL